MGRWCGDWFDREEISGSCRELFPIEQIAGFCRRFGNFGNEKLFVDFIMLRPLIQAAGRDQAAALRKGFAPHLAVGEAVALGVDGGECFEFGFGLGEAGHDAPAHHHELALTGRTAAPDDGLESVGRDVVVPRDRADVSCATDVEVLGNLLFVEEAVVASADGRTLLGRKPNIPSGPRSMG